MPGIGLVGFVSPTLQMDGTTESAVALTGGTLESAGQGWCATRLVVATYVVNAITETAIISVGTNSPNYDNIMRGHAINLEPMSQETVLLGSSKIVTEGTPHLRVARAATGTELTFNFGIEIVNWTLPEE